MVHSFVCLVILLPLSTVAFKNGASLTRQRRSLKAILDESIDIQDKPKWAAGGIASDLVNALIGFKPLFGVMKIAARNTLIGTAEKNGIPWRERSTVLETQNSEILQSYYSELENKGILYPSYYTQEFHAYDDGNLNWQAAFECESATMSMALRVWPKDGMTAVAAQDKLRSSFTDAVIAYMDKKPTKILDVGCSVGVSTFYLAKQFPGAAVIDGLDLSPYFLAVAKQRQILTAAAGEGDILKINDGGSVWSDLLRFVDSSVSRIRWIHGNAEDTKLPENEYDVTAASFVFHELPQGVSSEIIKEMFRVTAKSGVVAITDNNPRSPVIQGLPPALFTLMKSTVITSNSYNLFIVICLELSQYFRLSNNCCNDRLLGRSPGATSTTYMT
jgi:ubiquinone/menaquinone biosynthesis C-methylase UbiE